MSEVCCTWLSVNTGRKKFAICAPSHNFVSYIFATEAHIDNRKNLLNSNISCTSRHNMVNVGPLAAEIGSGVLGTPANFNGFCILALLLQRHYLVVANHTLHDVSLFLELIHYIHFPGLLLPDGILPGAK